MDPQDEEDFLHFESKVHQVQRLLEEMGDANRTDAEGGSKVESKNVLEGIDEDNFIVTVSSNRTVLNQSLKDEEAEEEQKDERVGGITPIDKYTFMQQVEKDAEERAKLRHQREEIAQNFRKMGNDAFHDGKFERAIVFYTKGIEHINDSPILYNNRALSYMKLKNYKRGIIDCEYVLNKLDEKNMRAWLYRAAAYKRMNDDLNFEASIKFAKKHNNKEIAYIDSFIEKMNTEIF